MSARIDTANNLMAFYHTAKQTADYVTENIIMFRNPTIVLAMIVMTALVPVMGQAPTARPARPTPPTRDPNTPGYVNAQELPDGTLPAPNADGNFIIGPTHNPAAEMTT